ncbi:helix-turn-helix domain-containing protein [Aporhodopirellula aestuarii]|uniref:Helix-turn-helix transcriptional regulator n=1 Tax=Aporhodopirellula aestuarii TaxID=2950107 RepID=A0ABT0U0Z6_9BACT|nr:helix-turn-helix transcriptional regulator [Aporhodopirellula aestuarii]MCM2370515.1 helix-turn-helix transcriptional regulator [Aporhodopirellula aestuarii]
MTRPELSDIDFVKILNEDPDIGVAIASADGEIIDYNVNTPHVFGADPSHDYRGKRLDEIFEFEFAEERLQWIREVLETRQPLRVEHFYQGHRMISTMVPMIGEDQQAYVAIMTKRDCQTPAESSANRVMSQYLDLGPLSSLTKREFEVLVLLGHGYSVPEAAKRLYRSPRTIEQHKASIGRKLGVSAIADIARIVAVHGIKLEDLELERFLALRPEFRHEQEKVAESE